MENTAKQIVFVVSLLGIFFILVMAMPSGFLEAAPDYDLSNVPDYWTAEDIRETQYWGNNTDVAHTPYAWHSITIGSGTLDETTRVAWQGTYEVFNFQHYWYWFGFLHAYNIEPYPITEAEVLENMDSGGNFSRFEMTCDHYNYLTYFSNNASYANLTAALEDGHVVVSMGVGWTTETSVLSGWDMVTRLLSFQLPDVTTELNAIIALPIWTLLGFLVFVTITMIVDMLPLT